MAIRPGAVYAAVRCGAAIGRSGVAVLIDADQGATSTKNCLVTIFISNIFSRTNDNRRIDMKMRQQIMYFVLGAMITLGKN